MASFVETAIPQFNPYIQQLPLETMAAVGMEKQRRYDEGVQRIQSQIDQVAGLDIYRPQDREYLQSKLNDLGSKLRTVAAGDFSNYQLVNSTAGMAASVAKDPILMSAVQSTAVIKNNNKLMEEAREKGELTPDNEKYYNKYLNDYFQKGVTDDNGKPIKFNSKYTPHFDVFKYAKETFDAIKPDEMTWEEIYETDNNGNPIIDKQTGKPVYSPVMIRMEKEGRFPKKVKETLDQIFSDPRVSQQLQITGEYNYRNYDSVGIKNKLKSQYSQVKINLGEQLESLYLKKNSTTSDEERKEIDIEISKIESLKSSVGDYYSKMMEASDSNPDQVKGMLYDSEIKDRYTTMFSYTKTKKTNLENPGWNANYKIEQASYDRFKFNTEMNFKRERAFAEDAFKQVQISQKQQELNLKDSKTQLSSDYRLANKKSDFDIVFHEEEKFDQISTDYNNKSNEFIYATIFKTDPAKEILYNNYLDAGRTHEEAIQLVIEKEANDSNTDVPTYKTSLIRMAESEISRKGDVADDVIDVMSEYQESRKVYQDQKAIKNNVDKFTDDATNDAIGKIYADGSIKPQTIKFRGREVDLSKSDIIDLSVYLRGYKHVFGMFIDDNARQSAKSAESRLRNSGKGEILDYIMRGTPVGGVKPVSDLLRIIGSPIQSIKDSWNLIVGDMDFDLSQVEKVYNAIDNEQYSEALSKKADVYKKFTMVPPNLNASAFTGNTEKDKNTLIRLKNVATAYGEANNLSPDFESFLNNISKVKNPTDLSIQYESRPVFGSSPQVEAIIYNQEGKRLGGMTMEPSDASTFIDTSSFVSDNLAVSENFLKSNKGKTSNGDPDDIQTYIEGDSYFKKSDFPRLSNLSDYDIQANIKTTGGKYYGKIYIKDIKTSKIYNIFTTPGTSDYSTIYNSIKSIEPDNIRTIIKENNSKTK